MTPLTCNNKAQNRIATCNIHDNFLGARPSDAAAPGVGQAKSDAVPAAMRKIIAAAGLEPAYRDLLNPKK
jgi:hypothetical protein